MLTAGSGADLLFGQSGNDTLLGRGGPDLLFAGDGNDVLTGGDADDQAFGQRGVDRMIWNPGDDTDLNEGGEGVDTVQVNGANGAEQFTATANGARVRFDRVTPAPFSIDIGTSENLVLNANGGNDAVSATGSLAALIRLTVDGGAGADTLLGSNGADVLIGGDGNDLVHGNQGDDVALLGTGDDTFQWDPGDRDDVVEGQAGSDTLTFNGNNASEKVDLSANGERVRLFRDVAAVTIDLNDVEQVGVRVLGGADRLVVTDLSGTDVVGVAADLAGLGGGEDGVADDVVVNATAGDDFVSVAGAAGTAQVSGLAAAVSVSGAGATSDRLTVAGQAGDDVLEASELAADAIQLVLDGGDGNDVLLGGGGNDVLLGGEGDDVLLGGPGADVLDGGPGDNVVLDAFAGNVVRAALPVSKSWLATQARTLRGTAMVEVGGRLRALPSVQLTQIAAAASS